MKKTHQRITRGLAAGLLVAALAATPMTVFADSVNPNTGIAPAGASVTIDKVIAIYNDGYNKSWNPEVTYTFEVSAATVDGITVTDSNGTVVTVKSGVPSAIANVDNATGKATVTCAFTSAERTESADNATYLAEGIGGSFVVGFDVTQFTAPGIYRFKIEDVTLPATLLAAGIVRPAGYEATKYLDVYVKTDNTDPTQLVIAGYVLIDTNTSLEPDNSHKDPGFRPVVTETEIPVPGTTIQQPGTSESSYGVTGINGDNTFDYYKTVNLTVSKDITGNMADTSHAFPFVIGLTNQAGAAVPANVYVGSAATTLTGNTNTSFNANLAKDGTYLVYGINPLATVNVKETNDTNDTYKASITVNGAADGAQTALAHNDEKAMTALAVSDYDSSAAAVPATITTANGENASATAAFENNLNAGTPTGIALMVAPFVAIAGIIASLFAVNKIKTKKQTDAE